MKKNMIKLLIFMFCVAISSACNKRNDNLSVYKNFYEQDVTTFNYLITNTHSDYIHIANFVDGLVENDKYGNIVPSIATSWKSEIIKGKQVWTFYLRNDVYWSDYKGNKYASVTSSDFVTTMKYILNYNIKSNNYGLPASLIENAQNYYNATLIKNYNIDEVNTKIAQLVVSDPNLELSFYTKIKSAFDFCAVNECSDNFDLVGIKAITDYELQFTLTTPAYYFLSALTYCPFLPANEDFIKEVGITSFGTNKKTLLYNGAYILKDYFHSSKIEYTKNHNYWDKNNVFIDKVIFNKLFNNPTNMYTRIAYETKNIDEFYVNQYDTEGWEKYITGTNGTGSFTNPIGNNTYYTTETTDFSSFFLIFNQNRSNNNYSTLTKEEISISNKALSNVNFRKALIYGLERETYNHSYFSDINSSIIPKHFIDFSSKDYNEYYIEEYANQNQISLEDAYNRLNSNEILDTSKSLYYLDLALKELNIKSLIKIEFSYYYSEGYALYDNLRIRKWNNILNGCEIDSISCNYDKVEIIYNNTLTSHNDFSIAVQNGEYGITFLGLHPNFVDPITYLEAFDSNGEIYPYLNHNESKTIHTYIEKIKSYYEEGDLDIRFKLCAELEYKIIFDLALVLPLFIKSTANKVVVSNLVPYQKMKANYGLSPYKFKFRKIRDKDYSQEEIRQLKEDYEKGRIN